MEVIIVLVLGIGALLFVFLHDHFKDVAIAKLEKKKVDDSVTLNELTAQATGLKTEAITSQTDATDTQKDAFWQKELDEAPNSSPTDK
jgi:hypothetical protein